MEDDIILATSLLILNACSDTQAENIVLILPFAGDRRVPGHGLWRHFEVRVGPIQERLATLWQIL